MENTTHPVKLTGGDGGLFGGAPNASEGLARAFATSMALVEGWGA